VIKFLHSLERTDGTYESPAFKGGPIYIERDEPLVWRRKRLGGAKVD
jgi:hypothetical protein